MKRARPKKKTGRPGIKVAFSARTGDYVKPGFTLLKRFVKELGMSFETAERAIQMAFENQPRSATGLRPTASRKKIKAEMKTRLKKGLTPAERRSFISTVQEWAHDKHGDVANSFLRDIWDELEPDRPKQPKRKKAVTPTQEPKGLTADQTLEGVMRGLKRPK